jgi:hypothetical protein
MGRRRGYGGKMKARLKSVDALLAKEIAVLEMRQEKRRVHLREIEKLIATKELELNNLKAQAKK